MKTSSKGKKGPARRHTEGPLGAWGEVTPPALTSRLCPLPWGPLRPHSSQGVPGVQAVLCPKGPRSPTSPAGSHSNSAGVGRLLGAQGPQTPPGPGPSESPSTSKSCSSVLASSNTWSEDRGHEGWDRRLRQGPPGWAIPGCS